MTERKHYIVEAVYETSSMGREEQYALRFYYEEEDAVQAFESMSTVVKGKLIDLWDDMGGEGIVTVKAFCYALPIPAWVATNSEPDFIKDMLPQRLSRLSQAVGEVQTTALRLENRGNSQMNPPHRDVQP